MEKRTRRSAGRTPASGSESPGSESPGSSAADAGAPGADSSGSVGPERVARPVTLRMLADELGLNISTVSRVLNSAPDQAGRWASDATAERIRTYARERGYERNPYGASLRTARSNTIGVVVPRLQDFVLATIYEGIETEASAQGLTALVANSHDRADLQRELVEAMVRRRVDGLIFGDAHLDAVLLDEVAARRVPFVLANRRAGQYPASTCDDYEGGRLAGRHLLELGCRDIAVLAGMPFASTARDRAEGVLDVLAEAGVGAPRPRVVFEGFDAEAGRKGAEMLLRSGPPPDALFVTNDFGAIGAIGALRDHGLRVPRDVALVGYNDTPLARELAVPLTTVRSPMLEIGRTAVHLLQAVWRKDESVASVLHQPELVVRESSAGWQGGPR